MEKVRALATRRELAGVLDTFAVERAALAVDLVVSTVVSTYSDKHDLKERGLLFQEATNLYY